MQRYEEGMGEEDPAKAGNLNYNITFCKTQLQAYEKLPVFSKSIHEDLESEWLEFIKMSSMVGLNPDEDLQNRLMIDEQLKTNFIYNYMSDIREKVHNRKPSYALNEILRVFMVVTLRQVLTQITAKVHSTGQDQR